MVCIPFPPPKRNRLKHGDVWDAFKTVCSTGIETNILQFSSSVYRFSLEGAGEWLDPKPSANSTYQVVSTWLSNSHRHTQQLKYINNPTLLILEQLWRWNDSEFSKGFVPWYATVVLQPRIVRIVQPRMRAAPSVSDWEQPTQTRLGSYGRGCALCMQHYRDQKLSACCQQVQFMTYQLHIIWWVQRMTH